MSFLYKQPGFDFIDQVSDKERAEGAYELMILCPMLVYSTTAEDIPSFRDDDGQVVAMQMLADFKDKEAIETHNTKKGKAINISKKRFTAGNLDKQQQALKEGNQ